MGKVSQANACELKRYVCARIGAQTSRKYENPACFVRAWMHASVHAHMQRLSHTG